MEVKRLDAYVSYFDSLKNFYIQIKNNLPKIHEISTSLQLIEDKLPTVVCPNLGDIVAVKYDTDGLWYRAKIICIKESTITVQFIDYGNTEISSSNLKKLPKHLSSFGPMAYHCMLDDIDDEEQIILSQSKIYDTVFEFITSIELIITFLNYNELSLVNIEWDNRNIKTLLNNIISFGITLKTYETLKQFDKVGAKMQVNLIHTESLNEFYVKTEEGGKVIKKIDDELNNELVWKPVIDCKIGNMVISKRETDNRWYRVRILDIHDEGKYMCYFIDYGVKDICSEFYEAVGYLEVAPPSIKRCSLHVPNLFKSKTMFAHISNSFIDEMNLSKDKDYKVIITILYTGEPCVVELQVDGINIIELIEPKPVVVFTVFNLNLLKVQQNNSGRFAVLNELNNIKTLPLVKRTKNGKLYGAYLNKKWYRVKLVNKRLMEVTLVDWGGLLFEVQELFALPLKIAKVKYLIMFCSLGLDERYFSSTKLKNLCSNGQREFTMVVIKNNPNEGHLIRLFLNNEDVTEMIKK